MSGNAIELKSVKDILGMKFFIPSYQRGYRWTDQQVTDLLDDIWDFSKKENRNSSEFYCLQPLVVKRKNDEDVLKRIKEKANSVEEVESFLKGREWEVIDGQQRLTTIFIILFILEGKEEPYFLNYETRKKFLEFLRALQNIDYQHIVNNDWKKTLNQEWKKLFEENDMNEEYDNIDFNHIFIAFHTIKKWQIEHKCEKFTESLLNNIKFIWYESVDEDPIKVFTRLNIGKIPLTNAELVKALLLNSSNFEGSDENNLRLRQQEIASEWDDIEYTLQNDEFWLFLHQDGYKNPTRIDFIFDLITEKDYLNIGNDNIGTDEYRTFRYFNKYFVDKKNEEGITKCWKEIKKYYQIFQEWFNDLEMYHYVGFLIDQNVKLTEIMDYWPGDKNDFLEKLKIKIKEIVSQHSNLDEVYDIVYKDENGHDVKGVSKTNCKPILLLHNIQSVINQNKGFTSEEKYGLPVFYKFPFHLYKLEKWDVEHSDSNTTNGLEKEKDQKEWLKYSLLDPSISENLKEEIKKFILDDDSKKDFEYFAREMQEDDKNGWKDPEKEKNMIWNFVLLDYKTNRSYGNAIFPAKRRIIIGKDQGKKININENLKESVGSEKIAFVPPVTKNVFLKYYNTSVDDLRTWNKTDAQSYMDNISATLSEFGVKFNEKNDD